MYVSTIGGSFVRTGISIGFDRNRMEWNNDDTVLYTIDRKSENEIQEIDEYVFGCVDDG